MIHRRTFLGLAAGGAALAVSPRAYGANERLIIFSCRSSTAFWRHWHLGH